MKVLLPFRRIVIKFVLFSRSLFMCGVIYDAVGLKKKTFLFPQPRQYIIFVFRA